MLLSLRSVFFTPSVVMRSSKWVDSCNAMATGRAIPLSIGCLLLAAASLKTSGFLAATESSGHNALRGWVIAIAASAECFCGGALVLGCHPLIFQRICQLLFFVFLLVSGFRVVFSAESCGCLGSIDVGPWTMIVLNLVALIGLQCWRPRRRIGSPIRLVFLSSFSLAMATVLVWTWVSAAEADRVVEVFPRIVDLGTLRPAEKRQITVFLRNKQDSPILVDHFRISCSCLSVNQPHVLLTPGKETEASFELDLGDKPRDSGEMHIEIQGKDKSNSLLFVVEVRFRVARLAERQNH
jgi:hypothetical protein